MFQTEYDFTLPMGLVDGDGALHREGVMRLATAADEILPQRDERVRANPAYLNVIILSRVITRLGDVRHISTGTVERLFTADLDYLQTLYSTINQVAIDGVRVRCDRCAEPVVLESVAPGE